jgi:hypothetical protein
MRHRLRSGKTGAVFPAGPFSGQWPGGREAFGQRRERQGINARFAADGAVQGVWDHRPARPDSAGAAVLASPLAVNPAGFGPAGPAAPKIWT